MKKALFGILALISIYTSAMGQYPVNWINYDYMNPASDVTRSAAYNPVTDHVLVATRFGGNKVIVLNAADGDSIAALNTQGILSEKSTYPLNMIAISEDGTIYVTNLSAPQFSPGATFKIYRYMDEQAAPALVFEDALANGRYGDAFAVIGSGNLKYLYSSGMGNDKMVVLRDEGGATLVFDSYITLPQIGNARHGISPVKPGGNIWIDGADTGYPPATLITSAGQLISTVPDTFLSPGGVANVAYTRIGGYNLISGLNAYHATVSTVRFFEDELGTITYDYFGEDYFSNPDDSVALFYKTGWVNNTNASGTICYDSKRNSLIVVLGYNSVSSLSLEKLLKATTPRDDEHTVSIDGFNDFYPTDHVGQSNGRDLYLTWTAGKVFFGITGHSLLDATETNRLYVAFDLDPEGDNGSAAPPEDAGGVTLLPFKADRVIEVDSWTEADYATGKVYNWNGSSWAVLSEYEGNAAAEGVLAWGDEGEYRLSEVAAIKNDKGIGSTFDNIGMMVYLAEKSGSGQVLSAYPDKNALGNAPQFGYYFYADSLGSGIFPTDTTKIKIRKSSMTALETLDNGVIRSHDLGMNYPNPFNPETTISYTLAENARVKIEIYDLAGRKVQTLLDKKQNAGKYTVRFDGSRSGSGVYFCKLVADNRVVGTRKMILIK